MPSAESSLPLPYSTLPLSDSLHPLLFISCPHGSRRDTAATAGLAAAPVPPGAVRGATPAPRLRAAASGRRRRMTGAADAPATTAAAAAAAALPPATGTMMWFAAVMRSVTININNDLKCSSFILCRVRFSLLR